MLPSTLYIMLPTHQLSLNVLHPTVKEKLHLQESTLFDRKGCPVLYHVTYAATKIYVATSKGLKGDAFTRKYIT